MACDDTPCRNIILSLHIFNHQKKRRSRADRCWRVITTPYPQKAVFFNFFLRDTFQNLSIDVLG